MHKAFEELRRPTVEPITSTNRCGHGSCRKTVSWKVMVPKKADQPGARYMTRYVCTFHKDDFLEYMGVAVDKKKPASPQR